MISFNYQNIKCLVDKKAEGSVVTFPLPEREMLEICVFINLDIYRSDDLSAKQGFSSPLVVIISEIEDMCHLSFQYGILPTRCSARAPLTELTSRV